MVTKSKKLNFNGVVGEGGRERESLLPKEQVVDIYLKGLST